MYLTHNCRHIEHETVLLTSVTLDSDHCHAQPGAPWWHLLRMVVHAHSGNGHFELVANRIQILGVEGDESAEEGP